MVVCSAFAALLAGCSDSEKECSEGQTDCNGTCVDLASDEANCGKCGTICDEGAGQLCANSVCACAGTATDCDGTCTNTDTDAKNCGSCGTVCADGELCNGGNCEAGGCAAPKQQCGDSCIDIQSDNQNCGACGTKCDETKGYTCVSGACVCAKDLIECGDTCVDPNTAVDNCGSCGNACGDGEVCKGGTCTGATCDPLTNCSGACVDTSSDNNNCGACGTKCETANGFICQSGTCGCAIGEDCSGQCVDTQTNGNHCGTCGNVCNPGEACLNGTCSQDCGALTQCGTQCVDTQTSIDNCGACAQACTGGQICNSGTCECPTAAPEDCSGTCADLQTDEAHCGACGNACTGGQSCVGGNCQAAQILSVSVECPEISVPIGTVMNCTATGTLQDGSTADLTGDPNLTWDLENDTCTKVTATETNGAKISNTPPTKGQFTALEDISPGCTVDVKATYVAGAQTLVSPAVTITITDRNLLSIAIAPDNPTVPYLESSDTSHLIINFKVLGTYDSGQVREVQRVGGGGKAPAWNWVSGNKTTADFATPGVAIGRAELTDKNVPTGNATSQITVTYEEDTSDSTTKRTANTLLTVVPGNATGASIQPSTATIPLGPIDFSFIVNFANVLDFDVTDICKQAPSDFDGPKAMPFTKHYQQYCGPSANAMQFFQVLSSTTGPVNTSPATWPNFTRHTGDDHPLVFPADAPAYTSRMARLTATTATTTDPAVIEGNFDDGAYSANRVFARAQVTVSDAALLGCRLRITATLPPCKGEDDEWCTDAEDINWLGADTHKTFPVNLQNYQIYVGGVYSDGNILPLTDKVTYTTTNDQIANPSNGAGTEGQTDFGQVGPATLTATHAASGVTCSAAINVVQGKLCGIRLVPLFKNVVGRRAFQVDTDGAPGNWENGPAQNTHQRNLLSHVLMPNEANWSQTYRLDAWYATDFTKGCPNTTYDDDVSNCNVSWDDETGDFYDPDGKCFRIDVTSQGTYAVIPDATKTPADAAISLNGAVATTKVSAVNGDRTDKIKATFVDALTATTTEPVTVCGARVADPDLHVDVWDSFTDTNWSATKQTIPVAGTTQYEASLWFKYVAGTGDAAASINSCAERWWANTDGIESYRLQITEDVNSWGTGASGTATVANDVGNRGEITGVAVGTTTITATFAGHSNVLNVEVGELDVQSCEVLVPATMLYHGANVGETMRPTVSATLSNGDTLDITNGFKAAFCTVDVDGDNFCEIEWSFVDDADTDGSNYFRFANNSTTQTLVGPQLVRVTDANASDNSRKIQAKCIGCQISGTTFASPTCKVSPVIEAKPATVSKFFIQTQDKTCLDAEPTALKMTQDTSDDLKACVIYNHGAFAELDADGTDSTNVNWTGGTSMTMENDGVVKVFANGTTDTITATHDDGPTDTISIEATADKFASLEIRGTNIGATGCAAQPSQPTDGLQGCEIEDTTVYFWLVGKRADASEQNLTYMVGTWGDDTKGIGGDPLFKFDATMGSIVTSGVGNAPNNGTFTDAKIDVDTTPINTAGVCTAACPTSVTANIRVYDADPTQASMTVTATPAASATAPAAVKLSVTAQPNQGSAPTIDMTRSIGYTGTNRAAFYIYDKGMVNGWCLAMPVAVAATSDITAEFDAAGGTSTVISKDVTLTANP